MSKAYLWDSSLVPARAARFENLVASHLLKLCHFLGDTEGHPTELRYLRDREGREVDCLVMAGRRPWFLVEAKVSETRVDPSVVLFKERLGVPWAYQVTLGRARPRPPRVEARTLNGDPDLPPSLDGDDDHLARGLAALRLVRHAAADEPEVAALPP